ncbi:MAG: CvpA family protein [Aequorivita sp.]
MNTIDIVLGLIFIIAFFLGFRKGLLRALASLVGLVVGVYCAMFFSEYARVYVERWFHWNDEVTYVVSFLATFLLIMILFSLLGRILTKVANVAMLGIFNKLMGGVFNVLKYAFLISVVFMFVNASENYRILDETQRDKSILYAPVSILAPAILPTIMKQIKEINPEEKEPIDENLEYSI